MSTQFLRLTLKLTAASELQNQILAELQRYGEPLRWAIVAIDSTAQTCCIEAVVTTASELLLPDITPISV